MATIVIGNFNSPKEVVGLNNYQYTVLTAGMHVARIRVDNPPSSTMTIAIQLNGSTVNSVTLSPTDQGNSQSSDSIQATMNCAVNDIISFVLSSSSAADNQLNTVKALLLLHLGSGN